MRFNLNNMLNDLKQLSLYVEDQIDEVESRACKGTHPTDKDTLLFSYAGILDEFREYLEVERDNQRFNRKRKNKQHRNRR